MCANLQQERSNVRCTASISSAPAVASHGCQRLGQIGNEIIRMLDADRKPHGCLQHADTRPNVRRMPSHFLYQQFAPR